MRVTRSRIRGIPILFIILAVYFVTRIGVLLMTSDIQAIHLPDEDRYFKESRRFDKIDVVNVFNVTSDFGNSHWFYYFINNKVIGEFGSVFYVKLLNVVVALITGFAVSRFVSSHVGIKMGMIKVLMLWLFVPDVLVWSTYYNLKDTWVLLFYSVIYFSFFSLYEGAKWYNIVVIFFAALALFFTRSYLVLILSLTIGLYVLAQKFRLSKGLMLLITGTIYLFLYSFYFSTKFENIIISSPSQYLFSVIRIIMTPFGMYSGIESYYNLIGVYYLIGLICLIYYSFQKRDKISMYFFLAYINVIGFYGFFPLNNGPRQKLPLTIIFFASILLIFCKKSRSTS